MDNISGAALALCHLNVCDRANCGTEKVFQFRQAFLIVAPEPIDRLSRIAQNHKLAAVTSQHENQLLLARCEVLELIHDDVAIGGDQQVASTEPVE
jgi:hypothetical protein